MTAETPLAGLAPGDRSLFYAILRRRKQRLSHSPYALRRDEVGGVRGSLLDAWGQRKIHVSSSRLTERFQLSTVDNSNVC